MGFHGELDVHLGEHARLRDLLTAVEQAPADDVAAVRRVLARLTAVLHPHFEREEAGPYPALLEDPEHRQAAADRVAEHMHARIGVARVRERLLAPDADAARTELAGYIALVRAHLEREEALFDALRRRS